jgi:hypothetical protein
LERDMPSTQEKATRLQQATTRAQAFLVLGGDLKSAAAVPIGLELIHAYDELAKEFGDRILKPVEEPSPAQKELENA